MNESLREAVAVLSEWKNEMIYNEDICPGSMSPIAEQHYMLAISSIEGAISHLRLCMYNLNSRR